MEVHHHPQLLHKPKPWKEYLLEFLMIFLAVTMGFFAENLRERISNNEKGEKYIESLVEDLQADTTKIGDIMRFDEEKITMITTMSQCYDIVSKNLKATQCMGVLVKYSKANRPFQQNNRTMIQLAQSGGYILLRKEDADSILDYERQYKNYRDFETTLYQEAQNNVRNTLNDLADFKIMAPLQNVSINQENRPESIKLSGPLLFSENKALLNKWFNQMQIYLRVTKSQTIQLLQLRNQASSLIAYYRNKHSLN